MKKTYQTLWFIGLFLTHSLLFAASYPYTSKYQNTIGKIKIAITKRGDTFDNLARKYDIGHDELAHANPQVDPTHIHSGTVMLLPTYYILPKGERKGIIINLPEKRMFFFRAGRVITYPVGIGREGWATPEGKLYIAGKQTNPSWYVPKEVRAIQKKNGVNLPKVMPPGPDNPLGKYAIRLSKTNYLIHGTNAPDGVGRRSSAGCLRMYPEDIKQLYRSVRYRTKVHIVNQPFKISKIRGRWHLESHIPLAELADDRNAEDGGAATQPMELSEAITIVAKLVSVTTHLMPNMHWIRKILIRSSGIPTAIVHNTPNERFLNDIRHRSI